jgi:hypothetical protein
VRRACAHYLIVRTDRLIVTRNRYDDADLIETRILTAGTLKLDPPGITSRSSGSTAEGRSTCACAGWR